MSSTITRGSIPRLLQEGVKNVFGANYKMLDPIHSKLYEVIGSKKAYELAVMLEGFGPASVKEEGDDITFDSRQQGTTPKYVHVTWGKGFIMTREAIRDELYGQLTSGAKALARSMAITKEMNAATLFNTAFSTTSAMPGGDALQMISTAHLNGTSGGTYSNRLAVDADFSEASLEDMLKIISRATDPRGLPLALQANMLVGHSDQQFEFQRVLKSDGQNDTANNALNAVKSLGSIKGIIASPYLSTDVDAWFITTNAPDGLKMYQREDVTFDQDLTFASRNSRFLAFESYVFGYDDPRAVYGSSGA